MKKLFCYVILGISILFVSSKVSAIEDSKLIKDMMDDNTIEVKMEKPETAQDLNAIIFAYVYTLMREDNYINNTDYLVDLDNIDYSDENKHYIDDVELVITDKATSKKYRSKLSYIKLDEEMQKKVDNVVKKIEKKTEYVVEDLSVVNYYYNVNKMYDYPDFMNYISLYSEELNKVIENSNITFSYDARMGVGLPIIPMGKGNFVILYNGVVYDTIDLVMKSKNIIYIPNNIQDTPEEYVKAAQKRVDEYLGENKARIAFEGKISDSECNSVYDILLLENNNKDELYSLTVGQNKYYFLIIKNSSKMIKPKYATSDIISQISVSSENSTIPLDSQINVEKIEKENEKYKSIEEKLNGKIYDVFDIELYSNTINNYITKLDDGTFTVEIPITKEMEGKKLSVYYINDKGEKEKHNVVIKDGKATFITDHFSIYTLVEEEIENPNTYDGIGRSLFIGIISIIGLITTIMYLKKRSKINA